MTIERDKLEQAGEYLRGTCKSIGDAIQAFELGEVDESALEAELLEVDIELCVHCGWWHEVCELEFSDEHNGGLCEQCREELGIAED